jgi:hypothetical protein
MKSVTTQRLEPVGRCIYCGISGNEAKLSDEHIIPFSLMGNLLLPKSSCPKCANITSALELKCGREIYGSFRIREQFPTRRPSKRPKTVSATANNGAETVTVDVPESAAIAQFPIFHLQPAGILRIPPDASVTWAGTKLEAKTDSPRQPELWKKFPYEKLGFSPVTYDIKSFARLCAKIGHGFAVSQFGMEGFNHWLPPYILNNDDKLPYLVGSASVKPEPPSVAYLLNWNTYETSLGNLLGVDVHLFPVMGQPSVTVIVGELNSEQYEQIRNRPDRT